MSANSDIRKHHFYDQYDWLPGDFEDMQGWIYDTIGAIAQGACGKSVLSGGLLTPISGMVVQAAPLISVNADGQLMVLGSTQNVTVLSPSGNPSKTLIVARPVLTDMTNVPQPTNPIVNVPLHEKQGVQIVVIDGTPNASPSYPATQSGDVILMGLNLTAGMSTITAANFDWGVRDVPKIGERRIRKVTSAYSLAASDDILEADATSAGFTTTVPAANTNRGRVFTVIKTDSSANVVTISAVDLIGGLGSITLEDQDQSAKIYSNGTTWRQL